MILLSLTFRHLSLYTKNNGSCTNNYYHIITTYYLISLHWYTCLYISTNYYTIYNILLVTVLWVLSNVSWTIQIYLVNHKIIASENYSY